MNFDDRFGRVFELGLRILQDLKIVNEGVCQGGK